MSDCIRLERAQNRAARLVTGAPLRTSTDGLRRELGWTSLTDRRKKHKLQLYHKLMFNPTIPPFIKLIIPNARQQNTQRRLRNASTQTLPKVRTSIYYRSFIPATTRVWNTLPEQTRTDIRYTSFKKHLNTILAPPYPPRYFFLGSLAGNLLHTKLRLQISKLNAHLFFLQKADSPSCSCGYPLEDNKHFLLSCPVFQAQRENLSQSLSLILNTDFSSIPPSEQLDMLIFGTGLRRGVDSEAATALQRFLIQTHRL